MRCQAESAIYLDSQTSQGLCLRNSNSLKAPFVFEVTRPASSSIVPVMSVVLNTLLTALKNLLSLFHRRTCASRMTVFGPPAQGNTSSQLSTLQSSVLGVQVARRLCRMPVCWCHFF